MSVAEVMLYLAKGSPIPLTQTPIGRLQVVDVRNASDPDQGQSSLDLDINCHASKPSLPGLCWLQLHAVIRTATIPRRPVGSIRIEAPAEVSVKPGEVTQGTWRWEVTPGDVELLQRSRAGQDPLASIFFGVEVEGLAKLTAFADESVVEPIYAVRGSCKTWSIEASHWDRMIRTLGYDLPPSFAALADRAVVDHPSWKQASEQLRGARTHLRAGEDDDALRECLTALEAIAHAPYHVASWKGALGDMPAQKVEAIAEVLSGMATYCNKVGHHRDKTERDAQGDLVTMPLDHWEAETVVGAVQFFLSYAIRLRSGGKIR